MTEGLICARCPEPATHEVLLSHVNGPWWMHLQRIAGLCDRHRISLIDWVYPVTKEPKK